MASEQIAIDLETLALGDNAKLLSIGACRFDIDRVQTEEELKNDSFYVNIDISFYENRTDFVEDPDVLDWWGRQKPEAVAAFDGPQFEPDVAVFALKEWIEMRPFDCIFGNSPSFDLNKLHYHFNCFGLSTPWNFRQEGDFRTLMWLSKKLFNWSPEREQDSVLHHALDDAVSEARAIQLIANKIREEHLSLSQMTG